MVEKRRTLAPTINTGEGNPDQRLATASEYIAYYLDRIEGHLERLAVATEHQAQNDAQTRNEIASMRAAVQQIARK